MNSFKRGLFLAVFLLTTFLFTRFAMNITQSYEQVKPHVFYLHIDNDFTKTEIQEIYNAGNLWTKASNGMIEFKFDIRPVEMNLSHMDKMKDNIWRAKLNTKSFNAFENSIAESGTDPLGSPVTIESTLSELSLDFGLTYKF